MACKEVKIMLILTRRVGETLMIGDEVSVTILGVKGNQVRIGIQAPKSVAVHREEIYKRIQREREGQSERPPGSKQDLPPEHAEDESSPPSRDVIL